MRLRRPAKATTPEPTPAPSAAPVPRDDDVIDTVGRTQQIPVTPPPATAEPPPIVDDEPPVEEATPVEEAPGPAERRVVEHVPVLEATTAGEETPPAEPAATDAPGALEPVAAAASAVPATVEADEPASAPSEHTTLASTTLVATELVNGLRGAGRHLARPSASESHLRTELTIVARRLDSLVRERNAYEEPWAIAAMALVHDAGFALEQRRVSDGWQLLRAAQTEMLDGLDRRELEVERANLVGGDLVVDNDVDVDELRAEVWAMRQTRNRYSAELDRRLVEAGRSLFHRGLILLGALVLGAIGVIVTSPSSSSEDALGGIGNYLTTVGLAMTGAAVSYVVFSRNSRRASSLSEIVNPLKIVLLRLTFGGVCGLVLVVVLQANIQTLVNVNAESAYLWAIVGGFAERFVDRLIDQSEDDAHAAADEACRGGL